MKPHFFVYEILKRKVVRRFMPMLDSFKQEWDTADNFRIGNNQHQFPAKQGSLLNQADSDLDGTSNDEGAEEYVEDVSVFEVSPLGNFLVAVVSNEFFTLKMLPRSTTASFRKLLTPSFMIQEHLSMNHEQDWGYSIDESQDIKKKEMRYERDIDQNLYVATKENNNHNTSQSSDYATKTLAEQLILAFQSFEDFVGSTHYKHQRLWKYHQMLVTVLQDTNALIYPPIQNEANLILHTSSQASIDSEMAATACKENVQILPKTLRKVLTAIKEYNFSYSVLTPQTQMLSGNIV